MKDSDLESLYSQYAGLSHVAALHALFACGWQAHAGTAIGSGDPALTAAFPSPLPVVTKPNTRDHG
jgi:hypothetical protein